MVSPQLGSFSEYNSSFEGGIIILKYLPFFFNSFDKIASFFMKMFKKQIKILYLKNIIVIKKIN